MGNKKIGITLKTRDENEGNGCVIAEPSIGSGYEGYKIYRA